MPTLITDPFLEQRLRAERARCGADRFDEVWEGVYMMAPMAGPEHQWLVGRLTRILDEVLGDDDSAEIYPGVNVSDRIEGWEENYRVPDVAVYLPWTTAVRYESFWFGGPDFAIEVVSPKDKTRDKLEFYAKVGTRELLIVDRTPWQLELFCLAAGQLRSVGISTLENGRELRSEVVPLAFRLPTEALCPTIHVSHTQSTKHWKIRSPQKKK